MNIPLKLLIEFIDYGRKKDLTSKLIAETIIRVDRENQPVDGGGWPEQMNPQTNDAGLINQAIGWNSCHAAFMEILKKRGIK